MALKIFTSDASKLAALEQLSKHIQLEDAKVYEGEATPLIGIQRHFKFSGPNGRHICFVMDLKGPPFCRTYENDSFIDILGERRLRQPGNLLSHHIPKAVAKQAAKDVLAGLNLWHSNRFTHGNLCSDQVLANIHPIDPKFVPPGALKQEDHQVRSLVRLDGEEHPEAPLYLVCSSLWGCSAFEEHLSNKIKPLVSMIGVSGRKCYLSRVIY